MRSPIALLLVLLLGLTACAESSPTDSNPEETATMQPTQDTADATTDNPATTTTPVPVEGDGDIGDGQGAPAPLAEAPDFGVSSEGDSGSISPYTSCWTDLPEGGGTGICADSIPQPDALSLTGTDQLVITYADGELTATAAPTEDGQASESAEQADLPADQENPGIWLVDISDLPAGDHVVTLSWTGPQGDAFTAFTLFVDR